MWSTRALRFPVAICSTTALVLRTVLPDLAQPVGTERLIKRESRLRRRSICARHTKDTTSALFVDADSSRKSRNNPTGLARLP